MNMINKIENFKDEISMITNKAECLKMSGNIISYNEKDDESNGKTYYFNDTKETLSKRIFIDETVAKFLNKDALVELLIKYEDPAVFMSLNGLYFVYETNNTESTVRNTLAEKTDDDEALYIANYFDSERSSYAWNEHQSVIVNVSNVVMASENNEYKSSMVHFEESLLEAIEKGLNISCKSCNEFVNDVKPLSFEAYKEFGNVINREALKNEYSAMVTSCCYDIER